MFIVINKEGVMLKLNGDEEDKLLELVDVNNVNVVIGILSCVNRLCHECECVWLLLICSWHRIGNSARYQIGR